MSWSLCSDDKEGKDCVTIWKERCKLLARENRRLKALKEGRQVLQELAATDYQNQEQENQYQQVQFLKLLSWMYSPH